MTFTYDLSIDDAAIVRIAKVRLELGDKIEGQGVCPDGANLSDEEIQVFLDREELDEMRAVAAACENLSTQYAVVADISVGTRRENLSQISRAYERRAEQYRSQYGGGVQTLSIPVIRVDGFGDSTPTSDVEETGSELEERFTYVRPAS